MGKKKKETRNNPEHRHQLFAEHKKCWPAHLKFEGTPMGELSCEDLSDMKDLDMKLTAFVSEGFFKQGGGWQNVATGDEKVDKQVRKRLKTTPHITHDDVFAVVFYPRSDDGWKVPDVLAPIIAVMSLKAAMGDRGVMIAPHDLGFMSGRTFQVGDDESLRRVADAAGLLSFKATRAKGGMQEAVDEMLKSLNEAATRGKAGQSGKFERVDGVSSHDGLHVSGPDMVC